MHLAAAALPVDEHLFYPLDGPIASDFPPTMVRQRSTENQLKPTEIQTADHNLKLWFRSMLIHNFFV